VNRPSVSPPGVATRPAQRPTPGGSRPVIGGGNNNIVNRPGGNNNFVNVNRPGWGLGEGGRPGYGNWGDHWYGHHVPPRYHGWYHGCWSGNWGRYWYAPVVAGATAWGLSAVLPSWGYSYGSTYSNPYYVASAEPAYDYSQPIAVATYDAPVADESAEPSSEAAPPAPESPQMAEAYRFFDQALAAFKKGDYQGALQLDQQALQKSPQDPVMHEVSALCMFALGDYNGAGAVLNNLLAVAPGMDWTTLSGLYGDVDAYTTQLRALEAFCRQKPNDAAARFVLAYHYLVSGHGDAAVAQLKQVVALQPQDQVAKRMLDALAPPAAEVAAAAATPEQPAGPPPAPAGPTTDLVGSWQAQRNGDVFELSIDDNNQFTWKAAPKGKPPITLAGTVAVAGNAILLESKDQGTMAAQVKSDGADQFQFVAAGSPPDDKGLSFQRVKQGS
jgi:tetratricopeptide (TPR) repeat protein